MIAAQRRALILDEVRARGGASINELAGHIGVSLSTVRRDLDYLTEEGYLVRSHGGALLAEAQRSTFEPRREIGDHMAHAAKVAIGRRAAGLLEDGQSVIFDSSSTVAEAALAAVARRLRLTACTNDAGTAAILARSEEIRTVVLGGTIRPGSLTLTGEPGLAFLAGLHADVTLLGIHSLAGGRLSETSLEVAAVKRRMVESSGRVVVLADSSKFQFHAFCDVCPLERVHAVVTDDGLDPALAEQLVETGLQLILAPPAPPE